MAALEKPHPGVAQRFSVISGDAPHLSARRKAVQVRCPSTGLIILFTDVLNVETLSRPGARFSCVGCGEMHGTDSGCCLH